MFINTMKPDTKSAPPQPHQPRQHMEHWQLITGGVAHDFNNLLTSILGQSALALRQLPAEEPVRDHIEKVIQAAEYAAILSEQLITYSKGSQGNIESVDLNSVVHASASLLDTAFLNNISLQLKLAPNLPSIQAERGQLQQVVMNLLINAAEAIQPGEGEITVTTGAQSFVANGNGHNGRFPHSGDYVYLQIRDDGIGIDPVAMGRVFDPFFTTKSAGRGMGLPAIREIVHAYQGKIVVDSQMGLGTIFTVYLPCKTAIQAF